MALSLCWAAAAIGVAPDRGHALPCPPTGGVVDIALEPAAGAPTSTALVFGTIATAACDQPGADLATAYLVPLTCIPSQAATCRTEVAGLQPGAWTHRILVTEGDGIGQLQAREELVLDASAGTHALEWTLYRSVVTVVSLDDAPDCQGCLRTAITAADAAPKPALIQFASETAGSIVLTGALPPLATGQVTIDGFDLDGRPQRITLDGNGLDTPALKIVSGSNTVRGLRVVNTGGNSDTILVEGADADNNLIEAVQVVGRTLQPCGGDNRGCVIDGVCVTPTPGISRGECGDDGIAIRAFAGGDGANVIRGCEILGAFDKGVKVSDGAVARVERSTVRNNADGGIQATLSGKLTATENLVQSNAGTNSANGLAANGSMAAVEDAAALETRGNIATGNALRGISVRSLSVAALRDDFVCGNGAAGRGSGFGLALLDALGQAASGRASGVAVVHNADGGVVIADSSRATFGTLDRPGANAFAYNGPAQPVQPVNFRNQTANPIAAAGNHWQHCGPAGPCDVAAVRAQDVYAAQPDGPVAIEPAPSTAPRRAPRITAIEPPYAAAGDLVRIYGEGFDAIGGTGPDVSCDTIASANTCTPVRGNCVFIDRQPAEVVAVTPTMLVVRAPFTCIAPVPVATRTRWSRGCGRATFCTLPPPAGAPAR